MRAILDIVDILLNAVIFIVVVQVILSWLIASKTVSPSNPNVSTIWRILYQLTEPILRPIRNRLPRSTGIDFAPLVLVLGIILLQRIIAYYIYPNVI
ncbi:MAG: YggT family protein [Pseudomonadota bacterium]